MTLNKLIRAAILISAVVLAGCGGKAETTDADAKMPPVSSPTPSNVSTTAGQKDGDPDDLKAANRTATNSIAANSGSKMTDRDDKRPSNLSSNNSGIKNRGVTDERRKQDSDGDDN